MNDTVLSVCIPTYNRAQYLKQTLENITHQFDNNEIYKQVEVVISDNASEDNTVEIVLEFQNRLNNIKYFRNDQNIGFDRNLYNTILHSSGEFCWTLNDDKLINPNALNYLLKILKDNKDIGFFCIDQISTFDNGLERKFKDGNEWLEKMGLVGGRLAQCIINKKYLPQNLEKYFGNYWFHLSIALEIIKDKPVMLIRNIMCPDENDRDCRWAKDGLTLLTFIELNKIILNLKSFGYREPVIDKMSFYMAKNLPKQVITAKIYGLRFNVKNFKTIIINFYKYLIFLFFAIVIFFTPTFILKFLKKIHIYGKKATLRHI